MIEFIEHKIRTEIKTMTAHDLWIMKDQFYHQIKSLIGNTANFTGITELICYRAIYHLMGMTGDPGKKGIRKGNLILHTEKRYPAQRGKSQCPDISICDQSEAKPKEEIRLSHVFSVKHRVGTAGKDPKDWNSPIVKNLMMGRTHALPVLVQDINRIENIRFGNHRNFKSLTLIFDQPGGLNREMIPIVEKHYPWHRIIVLENNPEKLPDLFDLPIPDSAV